MVVATKFATEFADDKTSLGINGSPEHARRALEKSLRDLGTDYIDLFYLHRVDPKTPIEESIGAMAEFVAEGKVRHLGVSETSAATLRRAHATYPITAIQSEYSLFERDAESNGVLSAARELGIGFVPFSPLGRGFITGALTRHDDLPEGDARRALPRFSDEAIAANLLLVNQLRIIAERRGITVAQLALAWLISQGTTPIPGTTKRSRLEENAAAADITLTPEEIPSDRRAVVIRVLPDRNGEVLHLYADMNSALDEICADYDDAQLTMFTEFLHRCERPRRQQRRS